jgi:hypothetical protein
MLEMKKITNVEPPREVVFDGYIGEEMPHLKEWAKRPKYKPPPMLTFE